MDPDEVYQRLSKYFSTVDTGDWSYDDARELWHALDGWLITGGFPPKAWNGRASRHFVTHRHG
jgi:hypothetical protein